MKTLRSDAGFTLIELMVTVALVGIMAGLAVAGAQQMIPRLKSTRSVTDLVSIFRQAPRIAASEGADLWLGIEDPSGTAPYEYVLIRDWNGNFDKANFDLADPTGNFDDDGAKRTDRVLARGEVYDSIRYYPGSNVKSASLTEIPTFYQPIVTATQANCSTYGFSVTDCGVETFNKMSWIRFTPSGEVEVPGRGSARFISMILGRSNLGTNSEKTILIVSLPYGLVETFTDA